MGTFKLEFSTDNAAFSDEGSNGEEEVSRILTDLARRVQTGEVGGPLWDINGNTIGSYEWTLRDDEPADSEDDEEEDELPEIPDSFIMGESKDSDGHQYLWAYDRERGVAALDYGGEYVDITGEWSPGKDPGDVASHDTENVWDHGTGARDTDYPWTQETVARILMPHCGY